MISYWRVWHRELTAWRALTGNQRSRGKSERERISVFRIAELKIWCGSLHIAGQQMPANTTVISNYFSSVSTCFVSVQTLPCQEGSLNISETAWCGLGHSWSAFLSPLLLVGPRRLLCPGDLTFRGHWSSSTSCPPLYSRNELQAPCSASVFLAFMMAFKKNPDFESFLSVLRVSFSSWLPNFGRHTTK